MHRILLYWSLLIDKEKECQDQKAVGEARSDKVPLQTPSKYREVQDLSFSDGQKWFWDIPQPSLARNLTKLHSDWNDGHTSCTYNLTSG